MWGVEVRARRLALGLSQQELASMLGIGQAAISKWEMGRSEPSDPVEVDTRIAAAEDAIEDAMAEMMEAILDQLGTTPEDMADLGGARIQFSPLIGDDMPTDFALVACARLLVELREAGASVQLVPGIPGEPWAVAHWPGET